MSTSRTARSRSEDLFWVAAIAALVLLAVGLSAYVTGLFDTVARPVSIEYVVTSPYIGAGVTIRFRNTPAPVYAVRVTIRTVPPVLSKVTSDPMCTMTGRDAADGVTSFDCGTLQGGQVRTFFIPQTPDQMEITVDYKGGTLKAAYRRSTQSRYRLEPAIVMPMGRATVN